MRNSLHQKMLSLFLVASLASWDLPLAEAIFDSKGRGFSKDGFLEDHYTGHDPRKIVVIHDFHANPMAHQKLQRIIHGLVTDGGYQLVTLEGARGPLQKGIFKDLPYSDIVTQLLLQNRVIAGVEAAFITSPSFTLFYGVENEELYQAHLKSYLEALGGQSEALSVYHELVQLKDFFLKQRLTSTVREYLAKREAYENGRMTLKDFLSYLMSFPRVPRALKKCPSLENFLKLQELEQSMRDMGRTNRPELKKMIRDFVLSQNYLKKYWNRCQGELGELIKVFERELMKDPEGKYFLDLSRRLELMDKLISLELTSQDWRKVQQLFGSKAHDRYRALCETFYRNANKRDQVLIENTLLEMERLGLHRAILVVGGFHSLGITKLLRQKGISYDIISPRLTRNESLSVTQNDYLRALLQEATPLERFFGDSIPQNRYQPRSAELHAGIPVSYLAPWLKLSQPLGKGGTFNLEVAAVGLSLLVPLLLGKDTQSFHQEKRKLKRRLRQRLKQQGGKDLEDLIHFIDHFELLGIKQDDRTYIWVRLLGKERLLAMRDDGAKSNLGKGFRNGNRILLQSTPEIPGLEEVSISTFVSRTMRNRAPRLARKIGTYLEKHGRTVFLRLYFENQLDPFLALLLKESRTISRPVKVSVRRKAWIRWSRPYAKVFRTLFPVWQLSSTTRIRAVIVLALMPLLSSSLLVFAACQRLLIPPTMPVIAAEHESRVLDPLGAYLAKDPGWQLWMGKLPQKERDEYTQELVTLFALVRAYQLDPSAGNFTSVSEALHRFSEARHVRTMADLRPYQFFRALSQLDGESAKILFRNPTFFNLLGTPSAVLKGLLEIGKAIRRNGGGGIEGRNDFWKTFNLSLLDDVRVGAHLLKYGQEVLMMNEKGHWIFPFPPETGHALGLHEKSMNQDEWMDVFQNEALLQVIAALNNVDPDMRQEILRLINPLEVVQSSTLARNLYEVAPSLSLDSSEESWSGYPMSFWSELLEMSLVRDHVLRVLLTSDMNVQTVVVLEKMSQEGRKHLLSVFTPKEIKELAATAEGKAFLRFADRLTYDSTGVLKVPYGVPVWKDAIAAEVTPQNFLRKIKELTRDHSRVENVFEQLQRMGEEKAKVLLETCGLRLFVGDQNSARYLLGFAMHWQGEPKALKDLAPINWEKASTASLFDPDYSDAFDPILRLRISDPALVRQYFRVIDLLNSTRSATLKERRTRDFQVVFYILSELYRRELLPWKDAVVLFKGLVESPLSDSVRTSRYPYQKWLDKELIPRLRTAFQEWQAPLPSFRFIPADPKHPPTQWAEVPWQDVLIRAMAGVYFQEPGKLYPPSQARIGNMVEVLRHFNARQDPSNFLLHLTYAVEIETLPREIRSRFPRDFPSQHEFTGNGDTWDNGHFHVDEDEFSVTGHISSLRSEIAHAYQELVVRFEQDRAKEPPYEYGILSGEFEDRALASALNRDIPSLIFSEALEYVDLKVKLVEEVLGKPALENRRRVSALLSGIANDEVAKTIDRSVRLGEKVGETLALLSPSQVYYLGDRLYQEGARPFDSSVREKLLAVDERLLKMGVSRAEFQNQIDNVVGIFAYTHYGASSLHDARLGPYEGYTEQASMDHQFAERLTADLVVRLLTLAHEEGVRSIVRPYLMARAARHIYRISNKAIRFERVPLRQLIQSITRDDVRMWITELVKENELQESKTRTPRSPFGPIRRIFEERRKTPESKKFNEFGEVIPPQRRTPLDGAA